MDDFDSADATQDPAAPNRRFHVTRPVTIRQLSQTKIKEELVKDGTKPRYTLNGDDFYMATFVGNIIEVVASGENTRSIRIEDGTGKVTATYTINKEKAEDPQRWRAGTYARVFGVPSKFKETAVVFKVYFIRPVEDPHEVFFHLMEAMVVTLQCSRDRPLPKVYDSHFAKTTGSIFPPPGAKPDLSASMGSLVLGSLPLQSQPLSVASTSQVDDDPREDANDSVEQDQLDSASDVETAGIHDPSDDDDGSTEYYTDQPPDSPLERSPSPPPVHPFARNHSFEGHLDREEGPSFQSSQSTQRPNVRSSDDEREDVRTPKGKSKLQSRDDVVLESSDDELEDLRSEFLPRDLPFSPPRKLKPDPYAGWSPTKRNIMVVIRSKTPGEEVNIKRALGEGVPKLEMMNAIRELVKEGEIETVDGINYLLTDRGPKYPRF